MSAPQDHELDRLLAATADVVGWDDHTARERIRALIAEHCDDPQCTLCCPPTKDKHMSIDTWLKIGKAAVWIWAIAAALFLVAAMVFGPELP